MAAHKTYALLRYVPTYWELPAPAIPLLIIVGAVFVALMGPYGFVAAGAVTVAMRVAYQWNTDVLAIVRVALASLPYLDRHRRLHP